MLDLTDVKNFSLDLIQTAGNILVNGFKKVEILQWKDRQDVCTNADLNVENLLISEILKKYPDHCILSEESGKKGLNSDYVWIIDPLDGTKHYLRHLPIFNISLALQYKNDLIFGTSFWPAYNELYWGGRGLGSYRWNQMIKPSKTKDLKDAFIYADLPNYKLPPDEMETMFFTLRKIVESCYRIRYFADAHAGLTWVASGGFDGFCAYIPQLHKYWDYAAGYVILKEAGGMITDLAGEKIENLEDMAKGFIASNGELHEQLVRLMQGATKKDKLR